MSFLSGLLKIGGIAAAPFTGGASLIPTLAATGAQIGAGLLGNKLSQAKPSPMEQRVLDLNASSMQQGQDIAKSLTPQAQGLLNMGTQQGLQPSMNYWGSILSGNRSAVTSAMAPDISRIGQGYQTAAQTSAALNPRGGPSASFNAELPFQQQRDVSSLLQKARPQAAQQLGQLGQQATSAGAGLFGNAVNALYGSTAAGRDILSQQQNMRELESKRGSSIGAGLFDLFTKYGMPAIQQHFGGGGGAKGKFGESLDSETGIFS